MFSNSSHAFSINKFCKTFILMCFMTSQDNIGGRSLRRMYIIYLCFVICLRASTQRQPIFAYGITIFLSIHLVCMNVTIDVGQFSINLSFVSLVFWKQFQLSYLLINSTRCLPTDLQFI